MEKFLIEKFLTELSNALKKIGKKEEAIEVLAQLDFFKSQPQHQKTPPMPRMEETPEPQEWELVDRLERLEATSDDVKIYLKLKTQLESMRSKGNL